jgi:hypothetical protein
MRNVGRRASLSARPRSYTPLANPPGKAEVVRVLKAGGMKYRSRVLLIRLNNELGVKKIFRPGRERFLARERFARETLSRDFPEVPPLLDAGPNYVISPYYPPRFQYERKGNMILFPRRVAIRVLGFLERLYNRGYAVLDAHPGNFLIDAGGHLRYFDYEFLHQYAEHEMPADFAHSWDIIGPPREAEVDRPLGGCPTWETHWKRYVQLNFREIRTDSLPAQHAKRQLRWARNFFPRQIDSHLPASLLGYKATIGSAARSLRRGGVGSTSEVSHPRV